MEITKPEEICIHHPEMDTTCPKWHWVVSLIFDRKYDHLKGKDLVQLISDVVPYIKCEP